jgi:hypothetical protein
MRFQYNTPWEKSQGKHEGWNSETKNSKKYRSKSLSTTFFIQWIDFLSYSHSYPHYPQFSNGVKFTIYIQAFFCNFLIFIISNYILGYEFGQRYPISTIQITIRAGSAFSKKDPLQILERDVAIFLLIYKLFQLFTRFKNRSFTGCNFDLCTGLRVASSTGCTIFQ